MPPTAPILNSLLESLNYMPYVYTQMNTGAAGEFYVKFAFEDIPANSLLFYLPIKNSIDTSVSGSNKLIFVFPTVTENEITGERVVTYSMATKRTFTIMVEGINGHLEKASLKHLNANRLAIFRFVHQSVDIAILVNNPVYNDVALSSLTVSNAATFYQVPVYVPDPESPGTTVELALKSELTALEDRLTALEGKFIIGDEDPEIALANSPEGTIYIRVKGE